MNADLFGVRVIESKFLPENVVLLDSGDTLYAWNTDTGEVRSMRKPDPFTLASLIPAARSPVPGTDDPTNSSARRDSDAVFP